MSDAPIPAVAGSDPDAAVGFEIRDERGTTTYRSIGEANTVIGRSEEATIRLNCETASRRHAEVFCDPFGRWWIRDLGSSNGTRVNGRTITEAVLGAGDRLEIGDYELRFVAPQDTAGPTEGVPAEPPAGSQTMLQVGEDTGTHVATLGDVAAPNVDTRHLAALNDFAHDLSRIDDARIRLGQLCRLMVRDDFHGRAAVAIRLSKEDPDSAPQLICEPHSAHAAADEPYLSRSLLRVVRRTETPALAAHAMSADPGAVMMTVVSGHEDLSAVACPLRSTAETLDLLYVTLPAEFGTGAWLTLIAHAARTFEQIESALEAQRQLEARAAIERELARASKIQAALVPRSPSVPGLDLAIGFEPCRWVGGDYVDVLPMDDGRTLLAVADVCGKGLPAALVASTVHSMVHTSQRAGLDLRAMMRILNEHICEYMEEQLFVTMVCLLLDARDGAYELVNAGHPAPVVVGPGGSVRSLQAGEHLPLGIQPAEYAAETGRLEAGHLLALFTDGLTEMADEDGRQLGHEGVTGHLRELFVGHARGGDGLDGLAGELTALLDRCQGPRLPHDDRTFLLACRRPVR
jgi:serine phosphatase RsbU (regulator of sigma subunit)